MVTKVADTKIKPAVTMDMIHIDNFTFKQKRVANPAREISMGFCLYGHDADGNRVFDDIHKAVNDSNMDNTVALAAVAGGQTIEDFMTEYAMHKATLTASYLAGDICDAELMAYFELAMARVAQLNGEITVTSIE